ncbi:hypothetical protein N9L68_07475 [bacterium]|nr:hypothetical protein [bacterium]
MRKVVDPDPIPFTRGDLHNWCVSVCGCRRIGPPRSVVVFVAAVAADDDVVVV